MSPIEVVPVPDPEPTGPLDLALELHPRIAHRSAGAIVWVLLHVTDADGQTFDVGEVTGAVQPPDTKLEETGVWRKVTRGVYELRVTPETAGIWQVWAFTDPAGRARVEFHVE
jgi:hypothetical protein